MTTSEAGPKLTQEYSTEVPTAAARCALCGRLTSCNCASPAATGSNQLQLCLTRCNCASPDVNVPHQLPLCLTSCSCVSPDAAKTRTDTELQQDAACVLLTNQNCPLSHSLNMCLTLGSGTHSPEELSCVRSCFRIQLTNNFVC
jgi:hypothetical protein